MKKLTKKELNELKGGTDNLAPDSDVKNLNLTSGCYCSYNDSSTVINENQVQGCKCQCALNS